MTIIVCLDEQGGVLFNCRRVSSDRAVVVDILKYADHSNLYMSEYSAKLFPAISNIVVVADLLNQANAGFVFIEEYCPDDVLDMADRIVIYYFNRRYPSDVKFPLDIIKKRGTMESSVEFKGNSHDRITREVYVL